MGIGDEVHLLYCGSTVELSGLNLGSGSFRNADEISIQGSVCAE